MERAGHLTQEALEEVVRQAQKAQVSLVRFLYCDTSGIIRGKTTRVNKLRERLETGIGLVKGMMAMNLLDQLQGDTGLGATGEVRLVPDPDTWNVLPYCERSASLMCDMQQLDHSPWALCPRSLLKKQIELAKEMRVSFQIAFEPEFMLAHKNDDGSVTPIDKSLCFSTEGMNRGARFINRFVDYLERQNVDVEQYYPELGHGQHEVSISHASALKACDRHIIYRETLRGVAQELGMEAYIGPKPFAEQAGNGCHLHLSAWDVYGERNLFWAEKGLSEFGHKFVAGLLTHLPALVALTCPSVNSYRRLRPKSWSSAYACWGFENREAAIRVPSLYWGQEMASTNIEIKCVDSSSNPYFALAAVIAAGLDGVKNNLKPPDPIDVDPSTLSTKEMEVGRVIRLPSTLTEALSALQQDKVMMAFLGEDLAKTFLTVKSSECAAFAGESVEYELEHHRKAF